jgi:undecaprenyl diphosphate synthase
MGTGQEQWLREGSKEKELFDRIDPGRLPRHVAVIMDGNGRWAKQRRLPRIRGHEAGIASVREIVESSARRGIPALTLYAFSTENWKRPKAEIEALMRLLKRYLRKELEAIHKNNIRFDTIGRIDTLSPSIRKELEDARQLTGKNTGMRFFVALSYSGRAEIVDACAKIVKLARSSREPVEVTEEFFARHLYATDLPDPDLLIRTSGEMRVSNFLLWQIAYAEIWVTEVLWPDFRTRHLFTAILEYQGRERRFGAV